MDEANEINETQSGPAKGPKRTRGPNKVKATARKTRIPMGGHRYKLDTDAREGYKRRWFNDKGDRLASAERAGYEYVLAARVGDPDVTNVTDPGSKVSKIVGTDENGNPLRAYLMETRWEFYDEDQAAKEDRLREIDDQIRGAEFGGGKPGHDGRYVPASGIKYQP